MSQHTSRVGNVALSPRAVDLRNRCMGALSRTSSQPVPGDNDLATLPSDITLKEAWTWWSMRNSPPWTEQATASDPALKRRTWLDALVTIVATMALLVFRAAPL